MDRPSTPPDQGPPPDQSPPLDQGAPPDQGTPLDVPGDVGAPDVPAPDVSDVGDASDGAGMACLGSAGCPGGQSCCNGRCIDTQSDGMNCGMCGMACASGTSCCAGRCITTATDTTHCGRCNNVCDPTNATPRCAAGACGVAACDTGFGDCNTNASDGCETTTSSDPMNCGSCGMRCPSGPNSMPTCAAGRCGLTCNPGFSDCDGNTANGCETDLRTSTSHCGRCNSACQAGTNATATCVSGACQTRCATGFENCNDNAADGCEVNTMTSTGNCGGCGIACALPNATAVCSSGACTLLNCTAGFANCDGMTANGCETATSSDNANCGSCRNVCGASAVCRSGGCVTNCSVAPLMMCGATCVDTSNNVSHCGACNRPCNTTNGAAVCTGGACRITCNAGFADCNGNAADGCEVNLNTDAGNCGGCGMACSSVNGARSCVSGACRITCNTGFANCDNDATDGCETNTSTSVSDCGGCGRVCDLANARATCSAGVCAVGACATGYGNCDGNAANGCELRLNTSTACGSCTTRCAAGQLCNGTSCTTTTFCLSPLVPCSGACVNTQTDESNCGACGRACLRGQVCSAGRCVAAPPVNDRCADATTITLTAGAHINISATAANANHDLDSPCFGAGGPDVFYRFTLTRRELVYADTFGAAWDTKLFFATSCTAAMATRTTGDNVCDDNQGLGCTTTGLTSQVYTVLDPGTYYLVLSSVGTPSSAVIHFEHIPVGSGAVSALVRGSSTRSGTTTGSGTFSSATCGGTGPEQAFWWVTCPDQAAGTLTASTCSRATWNTILNVLHGSGTGETCNNDACSLQSSLSAAVPAGAGLHALIVDGFSGGSGAYSVLVNRP